ncbi:hypothetical protein CIB84_008755 [Bambusicola thoracicus]|uniref:Uncharacterized protein n=1 Tax=Bambusicola thoracicus TaxID=9083 RepID=A0A2P4STQ1_BAMTH|nr:hypothetical protein CIB84_008755 [Bambusicola thoracicus]
MRDLNGMQRCWGSGGIQHQLCIQEIADFFPRAEISFFSLF